MVSYLRKWRGVAKFEPSVEADFQQDYFNRSIPTTRIALATAIGIMVVFAILDFWAIPSALAEVWTIRVLAIVVLGVALWYTNRPNAQAKWREVVSGALILLSLGVILFIALAQPDEVAYTSYYTGLILFSMGVYVYVQLPFNYTFGISMVSLVSYLVIAFFIQDLTQHTNGWVIFINNVFFLVGANIIGAFAGYSMEVAARRDFSQRHQLTRQAAEIKHMHDQDRQYFENISQIKDDFLRTATHDLKNPLGNIKTSVWLLERHGNLTDEKGQGYLAMITRNADQMQALITDLLDLARIETGLAMQKEPIELNGFLATIAQDFMLPAQEKAIQLSFSPCNADLVAELDRNRMGQVFANLVSNAIKYTPNGGKVELKTEIKNQTAYIKISDSGLGIPAEDIPNLFQKFYRVNRPEHLALEGTGLGLSIVKSIVEQHGGHILVESVLGQGTTFTVVLANMTHPKPLASKSA